MKALSSTEALRQYRRKPREKKKAELCNKMCGSQHESRGSWHVQEEVEQSFPGVTQDSEKSLTGLEP